MSKYANEYVDHTRMYYKRGVSQTECILRKRNSAQFRTLIYHFPVIRGTRYWVLTGGAYLREVHVGSSLGEVQVGPSLGEVQPRLLSLYIYCPSQVVGTYVQIRGGGCRGVDNLRSYLQHVLKRRGELI